MKGQIQPLTATLVTAMIIGSTALAFLWGAPKLDKRQSEQESSREETHIVEVYNEVSDVANSGRGASTSVDLSSLDSASFTLNEQKEFIEVTLQATNPPYPPGSWRLLDGRRRSNLSFGTGPFGRQSRAQSGVLAVKPVSATTETTVRYRMEFRNMLVQTPSGRRLEKVDLRSSSGQTDASDPDSIQFQNTGVEIDSGTDAVSLPDGPVERRRTVVEVSFE